MPGQRGFTLIELMVALAVMAIVLGFAVPGFQSMVNSNRLAGASNELMASLQTARMEAIRRNRRVAICASANPNAGDDATCAGSGVHGWIIFVDTNTDGDFDKVGDTLVRVASLPSNIEVSGTDLVAYRSDGLGRDVDGALVTDGNVRLRIDASQPKQNVRCIGITTGGAAVRVPTAHDDSCS
jgi:type IV fimbrial biogenesis protein FimT